MGFPIPIKPRPGEESVWDYPRPPRLERVEKPIQIVFSGTLIVDGNKLKGGTFVADVKSLVVTDVTDKEMNGKLTGHLKSDDFFSVEKHPQAKLVISSVTPKGGDAYDVTGKLLKTYLAESATSFETEFNFESGIYLAKITLVNGETKTIKLVNPE